MYAEDVSAVPPTDVRSGRPLVTLPFCPARGVDDGLWVFKVPLATSLLSFGVTWIFGTFGSLESMMMWSCSSHTSGLERDGGCSVSGVWIWRNIIEEPSLIDTTDSLQFLGSKTRTSTLSSTEVGVLFPSSMPESELEVLVEVWLGWASTLASPASLFSKGPGWFEGVLCLGKGTGTLSETGGSCVGVSAAVPFLGKGRGVVEEGVGVVGLSGDWSPSKLVWLLWHGSFSGDFGGGANSEESGLMILLYYCCNNMTVVVSVPSIK